MNMHQRNIQLVAIEMFKVLKKLGPEIIRSLFIIDNPNSDNYDPNLNMYYYSSTNNILQNSSQSSKNVMCR